jgi:hypothetical protein
LDLIAVQESIEGIKKLEDEKKKMMKSINLT